MKAIVQAGRMVRAGGLLGFLLAMAACSGLDPIQKELDFGNVYVGTSFQQSTQWKNNDPNRPGDILGGLTQPPYHIDNQSSFVGSRVPAGRFTPALQIRFSPTGPGEVTGRVEVGSQPVTARPLKVRGAGVWQKSEGEFIVEGLPPPGIAMLDSAPITPNAPVDLGTRRLGGPTVSVALQVRSRTAINGTAAARMTNGRQHFAITFPQNHDAFNIGTIGTPSSGGAREIRVRFTAAEIGQWTDVLEVTDASDPRNRAGIVFRAKVVKGE